MAQIIKHRRGTLAELNGVTLNNGELGIVTSSVDNIGDAVLKTAVVVGNTDGTNRLSIGRIIKGNATPDLSGITGGAAFNDMLYHETDAKALKVLNTGGNTTLDLGANITVSEIAGNISGSVSSTGSFGYLNVVGDAIIGGNLTFGDANTDNVSFGADISSSLIPNNDDKFDLGSSGQQWKDLYIDGTANIDSLAADSAAIGDLTSGRVVVAGASGELQDDSDLTFSTATLSATNLTTTGTIKDFSVASGSLTSSGSFGYVNALSGVNAGNINVGISSLNEIDTDSGNLTIDSAGGTVTIDDHCTVTGTLTESSTMEIKKNITTIDSGLDKVLLMRGVEFDYKEDDLHSIGVIAEEINKIEPYLLSEDKKSVQYTRIVPLLIEAIKDLSNKVDKQSKIIDTMGKN